MLLAGTGFEAIKAKQKKGKKTKKRIKFSRSLLIYNSRGKMIKFKNQATQ